jgi:hypothetical protein
MTSDCSIFYINTFNNACKCYGNHLINIYVNEIKAHKIPNSQLFLFENCEWETVVLNLILQITDSGNNVNFTNLQK